MNSAFFGLLFRHFLTTLGGAAVGSGIVSASEVETVTGAVVTLAGVALSAYEKKKRAKK